MQWPGGRLPFTAWLATPADNPWLCAFYCPFQHNACRRGTSLSHVQQSVPVRSGYDHSHAVLSGDISAREFCCAHVRRLLLPCRVLPVTLSTRYTARSTAPSCVTPERRLRHTHPATEPVLMTPEPRLMTRRMMHYRMLEIVRARQATPAQCDLFLSPPVALRCPASFRISPFSFSSVPCHPHQPLDEPEDSPWPRVLRPPAPTQRAGAPGRSGGPLQPRRPQLALASRLGCPARAGGCALPSGAQSQELPSPRREAAADPPLPSVFTLHNNLFSTHT